MRLLRCLRVVEANHAVEATRRTYDSGWDNATRHARNLDGDGLHAARVLVPDNFRPVRCLLNALHVAISERERRATRHSRNITKRNRRGALRRRPPDRFLYVGTGLCFDDEELIDIAAAVNTHKPELRPHLSRYAVIGQGDATPVMFIAMARWQQFLYIDVTNLGRRNRYRLAYEAYSIALVEDRGNHGLLRTARVEHQLAAFG